MGTPGKAVTLRLHKREAAAVAAEAQRQGMPARLVHADVKKSLSRSNTLPPPSPTFDWRLLKRDFEEALARPAVQEADGKVAAGKNTSGDWRNFNLGIYHTHDEVSPDSRSSASNEVWDDPHSR